MAVLVALLGKIKQVFASYVLTSQPGGASAGPFLIGTGTYSMPLVYIIILGCVALIGYFCWQSYRQEIHEEKLQETAAAKQENLSGYNLAWANKLINWTYMSSGKEIPDAIQRWMEDINLTLAKNQSPIKILIYGIREGSVPPWIREVGQPQKIQDRMEIAALLDAQEFGFTVSIQEDDNGKVIASTYTAAVSQFQCWYNVFLSRIDGQGFLAKFEPDMGRPSSVKFNLKLQSDQKISTTVPEVVADLIKIGVLNTPFYLNLSTWGPVIPMTKARRKSSTPEKKQKKDNNGNTISPKPNKRKSKRSEAEENAAETTPKNKSHRPVPDMPESTQDDDSTIGKSNTLPMNVSRSFSDHLKENQAQGLSGSLGSLIGIKRTPSGTGRGPAKPIRSREKRIMIKVVKITGLSNDGAVFCQAVLDFPHQKCKTKPVQSGSNLSWPEDELVFDLSSRSSEVKLVVKKNSEGGKQKKQEHTAVASAILYLDRIDINKPSEISIPLRTVNKENAEITVQLDFTENPVEQMFSSPRRSLDLELIASHLPPMVDEKKNIRSKSLSSSISSYSSGSVSAAGKDETPGTTVRITTTKKSSPRRKSAGQAIPVSQSAPNMKESLSPESDVARIEGTVAENALKDLSEKVEIEKHSPQTRSNIKKGKVIITAIGKTNLNGEPSVEDKPITNGIEDHEETVPKLENRGDMFYSTDSIHGNLTSESTSPRSTLSESVDTSKPAKSDDSAPIVVQAATPKSKKSRRTEQRPKSLVSGIRTEDMPGNGEEKEWPKVRRSRSLVFTKGKKKQHKTGSVTDLHKHASAKEKAGYEDENVLNIPENDLQKNSKKKKSKSITKLFSKLGRKPSIRKSRKGSDIPEDEAGHSLADQSIASNTLTSDPSSDRNSSRLTSPTSERPNSVAGSEGDSSISDMTSPPGLSESGSLHSSMTDDKGVKRSKSLRKRLFGGKRKTTKN